MKVYTFVALALLTVACGKSAPLAPEVAAPVVRDAQYDINIPDHGIVVNLQLAYPNGVRVAPITAQRTWDFTSAYGGSPNVYYGESAPHCEYPGVGIVVAPAHVAGLLKFSASQWPGVGLEPDVTYEWLGRFKYTPAATPGTYFIDPSGTCGTVPRR